MTRFAQFSRPPRLRINDVGIFWRGLIRTLRDPYRPERHYMRGPGPKTRAKQHSLMLRG
jgi:hypothetical protein